ncbi:MAG: hypothetical protein AB1564_12360 [Chloroflexota bacterium]
MKTSASLISCLLLLSAYAPSPTVTPSNTSLPPLVNTVPAIETSTAIATPIRVDCLVNPNDVPFMNTDTFMIQSSGEIGLCKLIMRMSTPIEYSLLFPAEWETSLLGPAEGTNRRGWVGFQPGNNSASRISVWAQFTEGLSLKNADLEIENDDTILQEKSTKIIGDQQVLVTLATRNDQAVQRYFIRYESQDKRPARLFVFEISIPTAQYNQPEFQALLKEVDAMIESLTILSSNGS